MINLVESAASIRQGGFLLLIPEVVDIEAPQVAVAGNGFLDEEIKAGKLVHGGQIPVFCMGTQLLIEVDVEIVQRFRILRRHLFFIFKIAVDGADRGLSRICNILDGDILKSLCFKEIKRTGQDAFPRFQRLLFSFG